MTVEEIKAQYSMKEIVERYGLIPNRSGFISCPFHQGDRTPSLKVYEKDFHCHACGANGDIFTFVQKMEDVSFRDAFRILGGTYSPCSRLASQRRREALRRQRIAQKDADREMLMWRMKRIGETCAVLRMLDNILPGLEPFSDEWVVAVNMKEKNKYHYQTLAFGTKKDWEEMRKLE